jgi:hypothetical protein
MVLVNFLYNQRDSEIGASMKNFIAAEGSRMHVVSLLYSRKVACKV